jgi:hypothetical protein
LCSLPFALLVSASCPWIEPTQYLLIARQCNWTCETILAGILHGVHCPGNDGPCWRTMLETKTGLHQPLEKALNIALHTHYPPACSYQSTPEQTSSNTAQCFGLLRPVLLLAGTSQQCQQQCVLRTLEAPQTWQRSCTISYDSHLHGCYCPAGYCHQHGCHLIELVLAGTVHRTFSSDVTGVTCR